MPPLGLMALARLAKRLDGSGDDASYRSSCVGGAALSRDEAARAEGMHDHPFLSSPLLRVSLPVSFLWRVDFETIFLPEVKINI